MLISGQDLPPAMTNILGNGMSSVEVLECYLSSYLCSWAILKPMTLTSPISILITKWWNKYRQDIAAFVAFSIFIFFKKRPSPVPLGFYSQKMMKQPRGWRWCPLLSVGCLHRHQRGTTSWGVFWWTWFQMSFQRSSGVSFSFTDFIGNVSVPFRGWGVWNIWCYKLQPCSLVWCLLHHSMLKGEGGYWVVIFDI